MMRPHAAAFACTLLGLLLASWAHAGQAAILGEVRVHGNHTTPDDEILRIAALRVGEPVSDAALDAAATRLRASGRFAGVEIRKRYRSLDDPSDILVIVLVDELPGASDDNPTPGPVDRFLSRTMWLPVLDYEEGHGFSYGARVSVVEPLGPRSRISAPLTWGGRRQIGVEVERRFERGPLTRLEAAATITRRVNPHFDIGDLRRELSLRAERAVVPWLRTGGGVRVTRTRFGDLDERYVAPFLEATIDTRLDPVFPSDALYATARVEQLRFAARSVTRWAVDLRGYAGLWGSAVLAVRAAHVRASSAMPPYEQALIGGASSLRGYAAGHAAGDNLAAASVELRLPVTSPLSVGRMGVKTFVDTAAVYASGTGLRGQRFTRGAGAGVFVSIAMVRAGIDVAWPLDASRRKPRWHAALGVVF